MDDSANERRLTTILAADVVGYSRLMAADEAGTLASLKALRKDLIEPKTTEYHGRVVKLMGDGTLMEFASVVDAVNFAADIQREILRRNSDVTTDAQITFRIGINIGDIIVDGEDIYGDGVNLAARLEALAEPGGICVSGAVFDHVRGKVDCPLRDLGERAVKNFPGPVRVYAVEVDVTGGNTADRPASVAKRRLSWPLLSAGLLVLVALAGVLLWQRPWTAHVEPAQPANMAFALPDKPSIAVLPFANMSGDPEQEYFADGIAEDLITDLSRSPDLFVISRNSTFSYKGQNVRIGKVAEELGVRYVLEGSVRRVGDDVRINAQLIDATTGGHLWAERYDGNLTDVFALQDRITQRIVSALSLKLTTTSPAPLSVPSTKNPQAYDTFLKGWEHYRLDRPEQYAKALRYFQEAAALDPGYDRALAAMASIYWKSYWEEWGPVLGIGAFDARQKAQELLARVTGKSLPLVHQLESQVALWRGHYDAAIAAAEQASALDSSGADSQVSLAEALIYGGQPERGLTLIESARRRDPHNEARYAMLQGLAEFVLERYAAAAELFERTLELNPDLWNPEGRHGKAYCRPCILLVASYGHLGRIEAANEMVENISKRGWNRTIAGNAYYWRFRPGADMERFMEGLRKAGLRE
mgnify:CR=1 FL=1